MAVQVGSVAATASSQAGAGKVSSAVDLPTAWATVTRAEWAWVTVLTLLILVLTQIPATTTRVFGPDDRVHFGTYWYVSDFSQYRAAMREGATSNSWLVHDHFSAEPHEPVFMYPLYVGIGKVAAATGLPDLGIYAAVELLMRVTVPISLYLFVSIVITPISGRRFAFVLAALSGGFGVIFGLGEALTATEASATTGKALNTFVETVTFGTFLAAPHVGFGLALTLLAVIAFAAASRGADLALTLLVITILLLAALHPFNLPVLLCTFVVFGVLASLRARRPAWRPLGAAAIAAVAGAPVLIYNFITFTYTPFWMQTYGLQNVMPSPRPWDLPLDYGVVLLLAPLGLIALRRQTTLEQRLMLTWLAVGLVWMYLPVPYQRRFAFGLQPALAALAALGWPYVRPGLTRALGRIRVPERRRAGVARRLAHYPLILLAFVTPLSAFLVIVAAAATNAPLTLYLLDRDSYAVGEQIAAHLGPDEVVAGSFNTGNILAGIVPGRVLLGYEVATLDATGKKQALAAL